MLVKNTIIAAKQKNAPTVAIAGGVAANRRLRNLMKEIAISHGFEVIIPPVPLCTDNGAMIATAGFYKLMRGEFSALDLIPSATSPLDIKL